MSSLSESKRSPVLVHSRSKYVHCNNINSQTFKAVMTLLYFYPVSNFFGKDRVCHRARLLVRQSARSAAGPSAARPFVRPYSSYYRYQLVNNQQAVYPTEYLKFFDTRR